MGPGYDVGYDVGMMCETKYWICTGNAMSGLGRCWQDLLFDSAGGGARRKSVLFLYM